ncbi:MAG: GNAT family N-acetyltransferase [Chloroflexi bacterium]|nr:GNAT family N-acetyltransferase [Chloroflexota bacterium]
MDKVTLENELLFMRPLEDGDASAIQELAAAPEIAANTFVPHPYPPDAAGEFIQMGRERWRADEAYVFAIIEKSSGRFAGCMGIHLDPNHGRADVGYWIGLPYWGRGLATAALRLLVKFGFETLKLNRIEAGHFVYNPASGRVMEKAGMRLEGRRRQYMRHHEQYKDVLWRAILREDYEALATTKRKEAAED